MKQFRMKLLTLACLTLAACTAPPSEGASDAGRFDFIVGGVGTVGCVVAGRPAQWPDVSVLALEAGPVEAPARQVPGRWPEVLLREETHEAHQSVAQETMGSGEITLLWGRGMGGSAARL